MTRLRSFGVVVCLALLTPIYKGAANASSSPPSRAGRCQSLPALETRMTLTLDQRISSEREKHAKLRQSSNALLPQASTMILIMLSSGHHSFTEISYIATRDKKGVWAVDRVGRTTSEFSEIAPEIEPLLQHLLTKEAGKNLDSLVADKCLYTQPAVIEDNSLPPLSGWQTSIAVISPKGRYTGYAFGRIPLIGGNIVTAITGW